MTVHMNLNKKTCQSCEAITSPLSHEAAIELLAHCNQWTISEDQKSISRNLKFKNFYETISFVNAVAWIANQEGHHPDIQCGYNYCSMVFTTHAIDGLSENDFICAAKVDALIRGVSLSSTR